MTFGLSDTPAPWCLPTTLSLGWEVDGSIGFQSPPLSPGLHLRRGRCIGTVPLRSPPACDSEGDSGLVMNAWGRRRRFHLSRNQSSGIRGNPEVTSSLPTWYRNPFSKAPLNPFWSFKDSEHLCPIPQSNSGVAALRCLK